MIANLRQFIELLRAEKEIVEIEAPVDPRLEAAEIHRRIIAQEGPALLFKNITGASFPLVTNLFGTKRRMELAFGKRPEDIVRQIAALPHTIMPPSASKIWSHRSLLWSLAKIGMKRVSSSAPILQNVSKPPALMRLPLLTTWSLDGGPFITLPLVYTEHPGDGSHNLGMYRMQRFNDETTGLHCQIGKGGGFHLAAAKERGQKLPVNVFIGGPPALMLAAIAPLPENVPELMLASLVAGHKLALAKSRAGSLPLLAEAEFALVGEVDPNEMRPEGPFGDHYGYYSLRHDYPVFRCKALYHRDNPIFTATVVGKPRQEDFFIGDYLQELLSPLFPVVMPSVVDLWSYGETGYHSLAAAVVRQRYRREAMVSAFRILGEGQLSLTKFLLVTDQRIDLRNFKSVLEHVLERCDFHTDLYVFSNLAMDTLDYTGPKVNEGSKGVMLGLGKPLRVLPAEYRGEVPPEIKKVEVFCRGCLVVEGGSFEHRPGLGEEIVKYDGFAEWPLIVLVDNARAAVANSSSFLWTTFTRFEPAADIKANHTEVVRNHLSFFRPILIDARMKPSYPEELECDQETRELVDKRWNEYFPDVTTI
ncbi:MAG: UbiD family decarboxylase [Deltaproteobacteria bacterium]|nr:UbiD family decarboxylase [Deltaproteobacteria bacterium]